MDVTPLPLIAPFVVTGLPWSFVDIQGMEPTQVAIAMHEYMAQGSVMASKSSRGLIAEICGRNDAKRAEAIKEFIRRKEADPSYTWETFVSTGGLVYDELCQRPWLTGFTLAALDRDGVPVGGFAATNLEITAQSRSLVTAAAMPQPGLPAVGRMTQGEVWGRAMRWILANDLVMEDGRSLDISEWRMPETVRYRWSADENTELLDVFAEVEGTADRESNAEDSTAPTRFTRR